jgi:thymidylate kinase
VITYSRKFDIEHSNYLCDVILKSTTSIMIIVLISHDCLISLFKELLNNKGCTETVYDNFIKHSLNPELLQNIFKSNVSFGLTPRLLEFKDTVYSDTSVKKLYKFLDIYYPEKWASFFNKVVKLNRLFRQPGFVISFLGTDGSGKSTVIERIMPTVKDAFHNSVYYKHLRPGLLPPLSLIFGDKEKNPRPVTNPHASRPSGLIGSLIRFTYYLTDYFIGYYIKIFPRKATKASVWLFDRYYYDYYFDQKRSRINLPYALIRVGQMFIPEPDLIICLGTDPGVIHLRKPELSLSEIEHQVIKLRKFASQHKRPYGLIQ